MKTLPFFSLIALLFMSIGHLSAETPPPNDERANAILLTGDSFTHITEVHCATVSPDEPPYAGLARAPDDPIFAAFDQRTVWWKWQSPVGLSSSAFKVTLSCSVPQSDSYLTHVEAFLVQGTSHDSIHVNYVGLDRPFLVKPNKTYYFRGFFAALPETTQPETVTLTFSGERHPIATNRHPDDSVVMAGNSFPEVYASPYTNLFYTWTPDTTGFPILENQSPFYARATVYPEGESFEALAGPVIAGETYSVALYTSSTTQNPVLTGGSFSFLTPADNSSFEGRKPAVETPRADRTELSLVAADHGREFWWTFTPPEDGLLKTTTTGNRILFQPKVFEGEQNTTPLPISRSTVELTANTTYTISLRASTGQATSNVDQTLTFYPTANPVTIVDPQLSNALRLAFNLPNDVPVPQAFLTDLSNLRVRAFQDCDDDDCSGPKFPLTQLDGLEKAHNLETLYLQGGEFDGHQISNLSPIKGLTKLETLRLPNALKGTDEELQTAIEDLSELDQLTWLSLEQNGLKNSHLEPVSALTRLETLDIDHNQITDLSPISGLTLIQKLDIDDNPVIDLSPLSSLQNLRDLDLNPLHNGLNSLPPLRELSTIKVISDDLGPLARLTNLQQIYLSSSNRLPTPSRLRDLTPIANLPNLTYVSGNSWSNAVSDLRPLFLKEFQDAGRLGSLLYNLARYSKADLSDPATAELFAAADIDPGSIPSTPDDPSRLIPDGKLRWNLSGSPSTGATVDPTQTQLDSLITVRGIHIESLAGIANAPNLRSITYSTGWITDLTPLSGLTNLITLNFRDNFINDVTPIAHLTDINIDLRGNPIDPATIPASWIDNPLVKLDPPSEYNPAEDIPDAILRSLIRIALGKPVDSSLVSADLANLRTLHADFANVRSLDGLEAATNLTGLSLRNNILSDLSPIPTANLRWLRVSGNPLKTTSLTLLDTLEGQGVIVDNNEETRFLSAITPSNDVVFADDYQLPIVHYLQLFPEVTTLFLSHNYLSKIPELANLPNLETVYLEGNLLMLGEGEEAGQIIDDLRARGVTVHTDPQRPGTSAEFFVNQPELREATADALNLPFIPPSFSQAQLDSIVNFDWERSVGAVALEDPAFISKMTNLEFLSLERSGLSDITFLEGLTKLQRLDLDFNQISDITPLRNITELRELDLNNNRLTDISTIANFAKLNSLDIDNNCIRNVQALSSLTGLLELELQFNKIRDITPLSGLNALEWIDIHLNGVDYVQANQAAVFSSLETMIDSPNLYPQHFVQPEIIVDGTDAQLSWIAEQKTYYQVLFSPTLEGPFNHVKTISTIEDGQEIQINYNSGMPKGFFKFSARPNP